MIGDSVSVERCVDICNHSYCKLSAKNTVLTTTGIAN
jgi:hypothetical protein